MMELDELAARTDPRTVRGISARMSSRWSPWRLGVVLGLAALVVAMAGEALGARPGWVPNGAAGLLLTVGAGALLGVVVALVRNGLTTLYLRFIWTRLNHHEASDILDRLS